MKSTLVVKAVDMKPFESRPCFQVSPTQMQLQKFVSEIKICSAREFVTRAFLGQTTECDKNCCQWGKSYVHAYYLCN